VCNHSISEFGDSTACRRFLLDATLLMRNHPRTHLLVVWAGILQQQQNDSGEQRPAAPPQLRRMALALWTTCASATLISCHSPRSSPYSRCVAAGWVLSHLPHCVHELQVQVLAPSRAAIPSLGHHLTWRWCVHRVGAHDCIVEMAEAVSMQGGRPAGWSLSSYSPRTGLPQVLAKTQLLAACQLPNRGRSLCLPPLDTSTRLPRVDVSLQHQS
jgi:hypothetical protein